MIAPYSAIVRASDPRRFPPGLTAYARFEYGEPNPQWLLHAANGCARAADSPCGDERAARSRWARVREAVAAVLF